MAVLDTERIETQLSNLKASSLDNALDLNTNPDYGLTAEMITIQFETAWEVASKASDLLIACGGDCHIHMEGEMGSGKTLTRQLIEQMLKIKDETKSMVSFKLPSDRDYDSRADVKECEPALEVAFEDPIGSIKTQVDEQVAAGKLKVGDVVGLTEIQFLLGSNDYDIAKNVEEITNHLRPLGLNLVTDCLKTLASAKPIRSTYYLRQLAEANPCGAVFELQACNICDDTKADFNYRFVPIKLNGEFLHPEIDEEKSYATRDMGLEGRLGEVRKIQELVANGKLPQFFIANDPITGEVIVRYPSDTNDHYLITGGIERYATINFDNAMRSLTIMGHHDLRKAYEANRAQCDQVVFQVEL